MTSSVAVTSSQGQERALARSTCPPAPAHGTSSHPTPYSTTSSSRPSRCCAPLTAPRRYSRLAPGFASTVGTRLNLSSRFPSWVRLSSPVATALNRGRSDKRSLSHVRVDCQPVFGYSCIKGRHRRLRPKRPSPASRFFQTLFLFAPAMLTLARSSALRNSFRHLTSARAVSWPSPLPCNLHRSVCSSWKTFTCFGFHLGHGIE